MLPMGKENSYGLMEVATMEKSFTAKGQDKANIFVLKIVHTIRDHGKMDLNRAKALWLLAMELSMKEISKTA